VRLSQPLSISRPKVGASFRGGSGSARFPVCGLEAYRPFLLGKIHLKRAMPDAARTPLQRARAMMRVGGYHCVCFDGPCGAGETGSASGVLSGHEASVG